MPLRHVSSLIGLPAGHAATAALIAGGLIVAMDWIPTPLNRNIEQVPSRMRIPSTAVHATAALGFAAANGFGLRWGILAGAIWYSLVLIQAIRNWWIGYFFGRYRGEITPEIFAREYGRNLSILPRIAGRPVVPDLQHLLIHLAVLAAALLSWRSFLAT